MTGMKKLLVLEANCGLAFLNGALNGREVNLLCEILRVVSSGRAQMFVGKEVRELWDKSSTVRAQRSPSESGSCSSLLLCRSITFNEPNREISG